MKRTSFLIAGTGYIGYVVGTSCLFPSTQATSSILLIENGTNNSYVSMEHELIQKIDAGLDQLEAILTQIVTAINYDRLSWTASRIQNRIMCSACSYRDILKVIHTLPRDEIP